jgi:hypothetical protein
MWNDPEIIWYKEDSLPLPDVSRPTANLPRAAESPQENPSLVKKLQTASTSRLASVSFYAKNYFPR